LQEFAGVNMQLVTKPMSRRERERKVIAACAGAISRAPDAGARAIFERSRRI
jgi:hypothetical protein